MKTKLIILTCLSIGLLAGCYYDVEEELYPVSPCDLTSVTYSATIQPILSQHCYSCHGNGVVSGGVDLDGYTNVKTYVDNGALLGSIQHRSGFSPMPKNSGQLSSCNISQIEDWINQGAPNN